MHDANDIMHIASIIAASVCSSRPRQNTQLFNEHNYHIYPRRIFKKYDKHKTTNLILSEEDWNTYPPNLFKYTELYLI